MQPQYITLPKRAKDLVGQRFGRLVALGPLRHRNKLAWHCQCDCGNTTIIVTYSLVNQTRSCGCLFREAASKRLTTHGLHSHYLYNTWIDMLQRCHNPSSAPYHYYGERGISVCSEWQKSIQSFIDYASVLPNYSRKGYTLDRINNNGNYEPGNIRWATQQEQIRNTRRSVFLTFNGKTQNVVDWAKEYNLHVNTLRQRLKYNWPVEKALLERPNKHRRIKNSDTR